MSSRNEMRSPWLDLKRVLWSGKWAAVDKSLRQFCQTRTKIKFHQGSRILSHKRHNNQSAVILHLFSLPCENAVFRGARFKCKPNDFGTLSPWDEARLPSCSEQEGAGRNIPPLKKDGTLPAEIVVWQRRRAQQPLRKKAKQSKRGTCKD